MKTGNEMISELARKHRKAGTWSDSPNSFWIDKLIRESGQLARMIIIAEKTGGAYPVRIEDIKGQLAVIGSIAQNWIDNLNDEASEKDRAQEDA